MKDTMKPFRKALKDCLTGNVTYAASVVPFYDAKVWSQQSPKVYAYFASQREQEATTQDCLWETRSTIDIVIVSKSGSEVSKDVLDDISQRIYDLSLTLPGSDLLAAQNGFQILDVQRDAAVAGEVQISPTESELQKIITLSALIFHQ